MINEAYIKGNHRTNFCGIFQVCTLSSSQDVFYHFLALLFYFAAFTLEAAVTAANRGASFQLLANGTVCTSHPLGNIFTLLDYRQYSINVAATVSFDRGNRCFVDKSLTFFSNSLFFLTDFCIRDDPVLWLQFGDGPEKMEDVKKREEKIVLFLLHCLDFHAFILLLHTTWS